MKKVVLISLFFTSCFASFAQSEDTSAKKQVKYGFNLGANYSNLLTKNDLPGNVSLSNNLGFRLGILADIEVANFLSISPKAEISFNDSKVYFSNPDGSITEHHVMPVAIEFITHFVFGKRDTNLSPYFFFGPNVKVPVTNKTNVTTTFPTKPDLAIDFGIGLNKAFTYFNFAPEIRYSYGLINVNQNPALQSLYHHNVTLVFNFVG